MGKNAINYTITPAGQKVKIDLDIDQVRIIWRALTIAKITTGGIGIRNPYNEPTTKEAILYNYACRIQANMEKAQREAEEERLKKEEL
jgi:hypothetical protein